MVRRVVIGADASGNSVLASDERLPDPSSGAPFTTIWEADEPARLPSDGSPPRTRVDFFPPAGGYRMMHFVLAPGFGIDDPPAYDGQEAGRNASIGKDLILRDGDPVPGMHRTSSVDIEFVVSGKVDLEIDGGRTVTMETGDWLVQNGTRHAWRNRYSEDCVLLSLFVGAHPAPAAGPD